jgi:7-cyano-7-deazaguanine synthase in queuosine biosynthesis
MKEKLRLINLTKKEQSKVRAGAEVGFCTDTSCYCYCPQQDDNCNELKRNEAGGDCSGDVEPT